MNALSRPDITLIARITLVAWQRRHAYLQQRYEQRQTTDLLSEPEVAVPSWLQDLRRILDLPGVDTMAPTAADAAARESAIGDANQLLPLDFDFDVIDWTFWEKAHVDCEGV